MTTKAEKYISKKIRKLRHEDIPEDKAVAIAYSMARAKGYDVPDYPDGTKSMEKMK